MSKLKFSRFIVPVAALVLSAKTQFRAATNEEAIKDYTDVVKAAVAEADPDKAPKIPFPRIKVVRTPDKGDVVVDGFQRTKAFKAAKLKEIEVDLAEGTLEDARLYALTEVNLEHGVRLTNEDHLNRLNAALEIPELVELSNNALAKKLGRSEFWVRTHRPADKTPKEVKTASGKTVKTKNIGKGKKDEEETPELPGAGGESTETAGSASGSGAAQEPEKAAKAKEALDDETEKAINKIAEACDGKKVNGKVVTAEKIRKDLKGGKYKLSNKAIRDLAQTSASRIHRAASLVLREDGYTPARAYAFIDRVPEANTKAADLIELSVSRQGVSHEKIDGYHFLTANKDEFQLVQNHALGVFALVPKGVKITIEADGASGGSTPAGTEEPALEPALG